MFNTNIILKTIITIIFAVVAYFIDNYYLFWLLEFYLLLLTIVDKNMIGLVLNFFIALVLLFVYYNAKTRLLVIGLIILEFLVLYFTSFTKRDWWKIKYETAYKLSKNIEFLQQQDPQPLVDVIESFFEGLDLDKTKLEKKDNN